MILTMKHGHCLLLVVLLAVCFSAAKADAPAAGIQSPLVVTIAVPEQDGARRLTLSNKDPRFFVVLRNISNHPVRIYAEDSSWGFYNLTLEVTVVDNKPLNKPLVVTRLWGIGNWLRNRAQAVTLRPGDEVVREVRVSSDSPGLVEQNGTYKPFPLPRPTDTRRVQMRAVFTEKDDNQIAQLHVWSGRAASKTRDYEVSLDVP